MMKRTVTKEPTCTEKGVKTYTCTVCGETKTEEIPAAGHSCGEWEIVKKGRLWQTDGEKVAKYMYSMREKVKQKLSFRNRPCL
ncbi:MAG: hypothetical protein ACLR1V_16500 [Coprococcus sp.]